MEIYENLGLIVAMGKNREIGYKNDLIWKIREDLNFFKTTTMGSYMIMGRRTYESMPKHLQNRRYIILSRSSDFVLDSAKILHRDIRETLEFVSRSLDEKFFVVGGSAIYKEFLPYVSTMHITEISDSFPLADAYFPSFDETDWENLEGDTLRSENDINYRHTLRISKKLY